MVNPIDALVQPITSAFSQQFKEMFGTLNEFIAASMPSANYLRSLTQSFKIQETLARSSLDYTKALTFLEDQLDKTQGSRVENFKEITANFNSGIRRTGNELLGLQSELRRTGVDTSVSRKVFSELFAQTGGNIKSQDLLAKIIKDTSKNQLVGIDKLVEAMNSVSQEFREASVITGDPTRADRFAVAMQGLAKNLPQGMQNELLKFVMSTDRFSTRLMTGTEDLVRQLNMAQDPKEQQNLMKLIVETARQRLDEISNTSDETTKRMILEGQGLASLYASLTSFDQLIKETERGGVGVSEEFARAAADQNAINKTMLSQIEETRRTPTPGQAGELEGLKNAADLTKGIIQNLGSITSLLEPAFQTLVAGFSAVNAPSQAASQGVMASQIQFPDITPIKIQLEEFEDSIDYTKKGLNGAGGGIAEFTTRAVLAAKHLQDAFDTNIHNIEWTLNQGLKSMSEELLVQSNNLQLFNNKFKTMNFDFYTQSGEQAVKNLMQQYNLSFDDAQTKEISKIFENSRETYEELKRSLTSQSLLPKELEKLNRETASLLSGKMNELASIASTKREDIDTEQERKQLQVQFFRSQQGMIDELIRLQGLPNKDTQEVMIRMDAILKALAAQQKFISDQLKLPLISAEPLAGVGAAFATGKQ